MISLCKELWAGRRPLGEAVWLYAFGYGLLLNLITSVMFFALFVNETNLALVVLIFLAPIPYNFFVVVAVWRSAGRYEGPQKWADLARIGTVIWMLGLTMA